MRRVTTTALISAAILALTAAIAWAAPANITNDPAANLFLPTTYAHDAGTVATYTHSGAAAHNVTATTNGPDGNPLFRSATISTGSTPVDGTQFLGPGSYSFFCAVHGPSMSGTLNVTGTPLPRPTVRVAIRSKELNQVAGSGKLKLKLTTSGATSAEVTAKVGSKTIGSGTVSTPGASTNTKLKLTKAARKTLAKNTKAKVTVTATVPFGIPATASRTLK